jgi:hypothetical protein
MNLKYLFRYAFKKSPERIAAKATYKEIKSNKYISDAIDRSNAFTSGDTRAQIDESLGLEFWRSLKVGGTGKKGPQVLGFFQAVPCVLAYRHVFKEERQKNPELAQAESNFQAIQLAIYLQESDRPIGISKSIISYLPQVIALAKIVEDSILAEKSSCKSNTDPSNPLVECIKNIMVDVQKLPPIFDQYVNDFVSNEVNLIFKKYEYYQAQMLSLSREKSSSTPV